MLLCRALTFQLETHLAFRGVDLHRGELCTSSNSVASDGEGAGGKIKTEGHLTKRQLEAGVQQDAVGGWVLGAVDLICLHQNLCVQKDPVT